MPAKKDSPIAPERDSLEMIRNTSSQTDVMKIKRRPTPV